MFCSRPPPAAAAAAPQAVLVPSEQLPADAPTIRGYDFNQGHDLDGLMESMLRTGLQATALGQAIEEVNRMVRCACSPCTPPRHILSLLLLLLLPQECQEQWQQRGQAVCASCARCGNSSACTADGRRFAGG